MTIHLDDERHVPPLDEMPDERPTPSETARRRAQLAELSKWPHALYKVGALDDYGDATRERADVDEADVISSHIVGDTFAAATDSHSLVLDIDVPARLVPSSTPGHSHLFVDVATSWEAVRGVLDALVAAGVIEPGYRNACVERGHTAVRLPWRRKGNT